MGKKRIDMTGLFISDLEVICQHGNYPNGEAQWLTRCMKCGAFRVLNGSHLRQLKHKACRNCGATQGMVKRRDTIKENYQKLEALLNTMRNQND